MKTSHQEAMAVRETLQGIKPEPVDHKAWAKRLQQRHQRSEKLNPNQIRCYRNALCLNVPHQ